MPSATPATTLPTNVPARSIPPTPQPAPAPATDDEILGLVSAGKILPHDPRQLEVDFDTADPFFGAISSTLSFRAKRRRFPFFRTGAAESRRCDAEESLSTDRAADVATASTPEPAHLRATFDANPELRDAFRSGSLGETHHRANHESQPQYTRFTCGT